MSRYGNEQVLVVPRRLFDDLGAFQGLSFEVDRYLPRFLEPGNNFFMAREEAEEDPSHKQIIPYALFHHQGRILHYVRGKKSGEQRLASKGSVGIGGHINTDDAAAASLERDAYMTGVDREMNEELHIRTSYRQRMVALLNHDDNEVGRVHLGVVHVFDLEAPEVAAKEAEIMEAQFLGAEALRDHARYALLETWSQECVDGLERLLGA